jgi:hypothetical protein
MSRKVSLAAASNVSLCSMDAAFAQDGGIWASRPHPRRGAQEESVPASSLPGLVAGLTVQTSAGKAIGRISKVVTGSDGSIRKIIVVSPVGNAFKLSPATLTVEGGVVTTTEERGGG